MKLKKREQPIRKKSRMALKAICLCMLSVLIIKCGDNSAQPNQTVRKSGKELSVRFSDVSLVDSVEIQIHSDRNALISKSADSSAHNPNGGAYAPILSPVWYPVIDVRHEGQTKGVAIFEDGFNKGRYSMNGMYFKQLGAVVDTVFIDGDRLLYWENDLTLEPEGTLEDFYLSYVFPVSESVFEYTFDLLSEDWSGSVTGYAFKGSKRIKIGKQAIQNDDGKMQTMEDLDRYNNTGLSKERLLASLKATVNFTMRMQDRSPNSPNLGGLNLFYDYEAKTYRRSYWIWASGPSIKLLLDTAKNVPEVASEISEAKLKNVALEIGKAGQNFQVRDSTLDTYGIITSRWKQIGSHLEQHAGFEEYYSIADALFLIGWGWMPLYHDTGDKSFFEDSKLLVNSTKKLLSEFEIIPMDYIQSEKKWKNYTISEAGFGTEGIIEVYLETQDASVKQTGQTYIDRLLKRFQQKDGLWARRFDFDPIKTIPSIKHTRGQGWAMEGLISSYTMTQDPKYKELATRMAAVLMQHQNEEGYWSYLFDKPAKEVGISEKGTALWSHLFYRLYHITKNPKHLDTARKALTWCLENQYSGPDMEGHGGIVGISPQSGVTYRRWFPMACSYTSGFFGLAVLEELKLQKDEK